FADYQRRVASRVDPDQMLALYDDYIGHCFASQFMSVDSFRAFLVRYGYAKTDVRFAWLFEAVAFTRRGYMDFDEFLLGIVCMEPNAEHGEARLRLIFR